MASSKKGSAGRPRTSPRPTSARPVTAATRTSAGAPERGTVSTPLAAKAPTPAGGAKATGVTPAGPSVRRSASATATQRQRQRQAQLEIQRRRQYISGGVIAALVIALVIGFFLLLPHSAASTTKNAAANSNAACPAVPAGTPALANAAPTVSGTPVTASDGLQYIDIHEGCGATVAAGATVTVNYTGWVQGGAMFDSSLNSGRTPFQANLASGVIQGWQEGLVGMKVGGVRRLIIPPALGYGSQAQTGIPANSTLVFDISLISIP